MAFETRDNSGSLFRNNRREKDSQPNATGKALIGGVMHYVDAWTKTDKNGDKWQSLSFKPVTAVPAPAAQPITARGSSGFDDLRDSDLDAPF